MCRFFKSCLTDSKITAVKFVSLYSRDVKLFSHVSVNLLSLTWKESASHFSVLG